MDLKESVILLEFMVAELRAYGSLEYFGVYLKKNLGFILLTFIEHRPQIFHFLKPFNLFLRTFIVDVCFVLLRNVSTYCQQS